MPNAWYGRITIDSQLRTKFLPTSTHHYSIIMEDASKVLREHCLYMEGTVGSLRYSRMQL